MDYLADLGIKNASEDVWLFLLEQSPLKEREKLPWKIFKDQL